ncbi:hypothetical protein CPLU01_12986 [Colletotrichum plurivorum]|uniref:Uncharacterized protein n=1 Tax=Colletotrichum plurivorum TaxID=2175906 RepID=A0A8H6JVR8_9PEZI|nr:hypothetical protein CPLU01_12986 [Colletotrichum plurivorum]
MSYQKGHKHTQINFNLVAEEFQSDSRYQQHRRPQWNMSNDDSSSIAQRRVARTDPGPPVTGPHLDGNMDEEYCIIEPFHDSTSDHPSVSTGSDNTVVGPAPPRAGPVLGGLNSLTEDIMEIHNMIQPLGTVTTFEWVHGRRCPGDMDIKDISSRESMKVRRGGSRVSPSTVAGEEDFSIVNHPSGAFLAGAGDWADVNTLPNSFDKDLSMSMTLDSSSI